MTKCVICKDDYDDADLVHGAWEDKFIGSCIEACGHDKCTSRLSSAQVEKIQEIHEKHFA